MPRSIFPASDCRISSRNKKHTLGKVPIDEVTK
jgi:hypothetical protein